MILDKEKLQDATAAELFDAWSALLRESRRRGILRTNNPPAGDYAEYLAHRVLGGELAPNSKKGWDLRSAAGELLQVKARVVTDPGFAGERQLSVFRSRRFEAVVVVLFNADYTIFRAARLPRPLVEACWRWRKHVNGWVLHATDKLFDETGVEDLTKALSSAAGDGLRVPATTGQAAAGEAIVAAACGG